MNIKQINEEIFYTQDSITTVTSRDIEFLKSKAAGNKRRRVRLCAHKDTEESLHEMLIIFYAKDTYICPHKHIQKSESFHLIEGELNVLIFTETGVIQEVINMGDYNSGKNFYYRLTKECFHTVMLVSDFVVFHETTNGPFRREDTVFAPWAPKDEEIQKQKIYLNQLTKQLVNRDKF